MNTIKAKMDLLKIASDAPCRDVESLVKSTLQPSEIFLRSHLLAHFADIVAQLLDRAGDKADYVIAVRFRHQSHASTSPFFA
ncbi:MAG TPA: hypothetical protein VLR92_04420, partial [Blastocatellia bacterium]|nr:hypothetical protein [Blastocatellia bacterium]